MNGLRAPETVMKLSCLGSSHQTRLSFMRVLLRKLRQAGWTSDRPVWNIDDTGVGHAVYRVSGPNQSYSLVAFAHDLPADLRSDRVIAEAWDATFTLVDGDVDAQDIARLQDNVPLQEAGRVSDRELVLSRANRSVRLWDHVVDALAGGEQPDMKKVADVGYLMRTTAVYGSGKFGAADFDALKGRDILDGPFRAEMLAVWLIRTFVVDLVEHMARVKGGQRAVPLDPNLRRQFGIGNSTGLGMAPFLANHPTLLNAWISARETALARVLALSRATAGTKSAFVEALAKTTNLVECWNTKHPYQQAKIDDLQSDLTKLEDHLNSNPLDGSEPWHRLYDWAAQHLTTEGRELLVTLIIEPHGDLVDDLADTMCADEASDFRIDGAMTVADLRNQLTQSYQWALGFDDADPSDCARFWYTSEAKLEPRLGERHEEPGSELEQPLDIARCVKALADDLTSVEDGATTASFLLKHPVHRHIVRRVQRTAAAPFSEIQDNLIAADMLPIDMLRCKLAFFGATRFDPRSDRWLRITMFQGAPYPHELSEMTEDDWVWPERVA